jgi:carboxymethylenebutenolidase
MCYDSNARPPIPPGDGGTAQSRDLVLTAADGNRFAAFLATPDAPKGTGVIIYPDVRGLHQFYKDLAVRFAEQGVAALAIDYFGRTAGLTPRDDAFEYMPHVQQMRFETFQRDVEAALDHLRSTGDRPGAVFTVGFCMGGTLSFFTGTRDLGLAGVIGFYSGMSRDFGTGGTLLERAASIKYPALGLFGGADAGIPVEQVEAFDRELDRAGVEHEIVIYPGAPHSFFDRRATDYAEASADAWRRVLGFIAAHAGRQEAASR